MLYHVSMGAKAIISFLFRIPHSVSRFYVGDRRAGAHLIWDHMVSSDLFCIVMLVCVYELASCFSISNSVLFWFLV